MKENIILTLHKIFSGDIKKDKNICCEMTKIRNSREILNKYGEKLGQAVKRKFKKQRIDYILPVPLHKLREKSRGYNQADVLAGEISKISGIPILENIAKREKNTKELKKMFFHERKKEVEAAFKVKNSKVIKNKKILIIDDVIASGATINALTDVLAEAGAEKVFVAAVFRIKH